MKNLKKPTYQQKKLITKAGYECTAYLVKEETPDALVIVDKVNGNAVRIEKH